MILRLLTARVVEGADGELLRGLRSEVVPSMRGLRGLRALTHGFRREGSETRHLALSAWDDLDSILALAGTLDRPVAGQPVDRFLEDIRIEHYEMVEPHDPGVVDLDGPVIGVVRADVAPGSDAAAIELIRNVRPEVEAAGVLALHVGRRIHEGRTQLVVLAVWRDRPSLHRFAQRRQRGVISPEFLGHLSSWSFETYDCLGPDRMGVPAAGPAVLIADDDGRYIDASAGVEAVLGVPGELLLHRSIADFTSPAQPVPFEAAWSAFLRERHQEGSYELEMPDGRRVAVRFRAVADVPEVGLHTSILTAADAPDDPRPVQDLVEEAFRREDRATAVSAG